VVVAEEAVAAATATPTEMMTGHMAAVDAVAGAEGDEVMDEEAGGMVTTVRTKKGK
jgi:hypothetical protein